MTESPLGVCVLVHFIRGALISLKESAVSHDYLLAALRKPKEDDDFCDGKVLAYPWPAGAG